MTTQLTESDKASCLLKRENNNEFLKQRTPAWYEARSRMLTASEISSVIDCNIYQSSYDLILQKLASRASSVVNSPATNWGNKFEPIAIKFYEFLVGESVYGIGLVTHAIHKWLGASPDGLILSGKLLEIKCPHNRIIGGDPPIRYWIQMQIQMEVCNMNECDYLECKFYQYATNVEYESDTSCDINSKGVHTDSNGNIIYWRLDRCSLKNIVRDRVWFATHLDSLKKFHTKMIYYKELGHIGLESLYNDVKKSNKRLRIESKTTKLTKLARSMPNDSDPTNVDFIDWRVWVSASNIRNFMVDDPLLDWLDYYSRCNTKPYIKHSSCEYNYIDEPNRCTSLEDFITTHDFNNTPNAFQSCIMKKGVIFEALIINIIKEKFPDKFVEIGSYQHAKSTRKYLETVDHIKKGTPIIYQGVLHDHDTKTFGMPDLLVRSDYLNKIFDSIVIDASKIIKSNNDNPWHYRVVEVKFSTLDLCADGIHLRNSNKNMLSNKGQLYIYNKILGKIQNYTPSKSYILGKKTVYKKNSCVFIGEPFNRAAHIDFRVNDFDIRSKTANAVNWIRNMRSQGHLWKLFPPSRKELRPNMCNSGDGVMYTIKEKIAEKQNDITQLWMCGVANREYADKYGIVNWRTNPNLVSENLGVSGDKTVSTLQLIIDYNQDTTLVEPFIPTSELPKKYLIHPNKIKTNLFKWRKSQNIEMFIDFETVSDLISDEFSGSLIFNVGIGYLIDGKIKFKGFTVDELTIVGEKKLIIDMHTFIHDMTQKHNNGKQPKLWHWSHAERTFYRSSIGRHINVIPTNQLLNNWCDLLKIFKDEPIVVRGSLNFSLKSVVKAFSDHGFINTNYQESKVANGLDAMVLAYQEHLKCQTNGMRLIDSKIIKDIEYYNQIDCKVLCEILLYLRASH